MGINLVPTEISNIYNPILAEVFFAIIGLVFIATGIKAFRDSATAKHITTGIFWTIMGVCFIVGQYIPSWIVGVLIVASAVITAIGGVVQTKNDVPTKEETRANADRIGYKIFIPALTLALVSVVAAWLGLVSGNNAIGVSAVFGAIAVFAITKAPAKSIVTEGSRLLDNMGPVAFLPQLLAALGVLFYDLRRRRRYLQRRSQYYSGWKPLYCRCRILYRYGAVHHHYGQWFCRLLGHYSRGWHPVFNHAGSKSRCSWSNGVNGGLLRHFADADGCEL